MGYISVHTHSFASPQDHAIWSWHSSSTLTYACLFSLLPHCYLMNLSGNIDGSNIKKNPGCRRNMNKHAQKQHSRLWGHHKGLGKINWNKGGNSWEHCLWTRTWTCYQARQYRGAKWVFDGWFYDSHSGSLVHIPGFLLLASILLNYEVPERQKPGFSIQGDLICYTEHTSQFARNVSQSRAWLASQVNTVFIHCDGFVHTHGIHDIHLITWKWEHCYSLKCLQLERENAQRKKLNFEQWKESYYQEINPLVFITGKGWISLYQVKSLRAGKLKPFAMHKTYKKLQNSIFETGFFVASHRYRVKFWLAWKLTHRTNTFGQSVVIPVFKVLHWKMHFTGHSYHFHSLP